MQALKKKSFNLFYYKFLSQPLRASSKFIIIIHPLIHKLAFFHLRTVHLKISAICSLDKKVNYKTNKKKPIKISPNISLAETPKHLGNMQIEILTKYEKRNGK